MEEAQDTLATLAARRDGRSDLAVRIAHLEAEARGAWAAELWERRWSWWVRVSWTWAVSESTALRHLTAWAERLQAGDRGIALAMGLHGQPYRHGHGLLYLPSPIAPPPNPQQACATLLARTFLAWPYGDWWLQPFRPWRHGAEQRGHGAAQYLSREPGTVMTFGEAPIYRARRAR